MASQRRRSGWTVSRLSHSLRLGPNLGWLLGALSLLGIVEGAGCNGAMFHDGDGETPFVSAQQSCPTTLVAQRIGAGDTVLRVEGDSALRGARLEIPSGALPSGTMVRLGMGPALSGANIAAVAGTAHGPSLCVETDQPTESAVPQFGKPALLIMPYDPLRLEGRSMNHLAMYMSDGRGAVPVRKGDLLLVDETRHLAGSEIGKPGIYGIITVGTGLPAANSMLSVLFVIDNSGSMIPKQKMLAKLFPRFFEQVTRTAATHDERVRKCVQYNIGVITTDVGSSVAEFGDNGKLVDKFCDARTQTNWSADAKTACSNAACPSVTKLGKRYISRDMMVSPEENQKQFQCLAIVGDGGSGVEQPLESLSRALSGDDDIKLPLPMGKTQFFRAAGLNSVVFLTDEGDCSMDAKPDPVTLRSRRDEFFTPTEVCDRRDPKQPSCYADLNHRCLGTAMRCNPSLTTTMKSSLTCSDLESGAIGLRPAKAYADELYTFINTLNPTDKTEIEHLFVRGIWPIRKGATSLETTITFTFNPQNRPPSNTLGNEAFCFDPATVMTAEPILGHPQVRLNTFIKSLIPLGMPGDPDPGQAKIGSICSPEDRENVLEDLAKTIIDSPKICPMPLG